MPSSILLFASGHNQVELEDMYTACKGPQYSEFCIEKEGLGSVLEMTVQRNASNSKPAGQALVSADSMRTLSAKGCASLPLLLLLLPIVLNGIKSEYLLQTMRPAFVRSTRSAET
jgi:hypothetical protein